MQSTGRNCHTHCTAPGVGLVATHLERGIQCRGERVQVLGKRVLCIIDYVPPVHVLAAGQQLHLGHAGSLATCMNPCGHYRTWCLLGERSRSAGHANGTSIVSCQSTNGAHAHRYRAWSTSCQALFDAIAAANRYNSPATLLVFALSSAQSGARGRRGEMTVWTVLLCRSMELHCLKKKTPRIFCCPIPSELPA